MFPARVVVEGAGALEYDSCRNHLTSPEIIQPRPLVEQFTVFPIYDGVGFKRCLKFLDADNWEQLLRSP